MRVHVLVDQGLSQFVSAFFDGVLLFDLVLSFPSFCIYHLLNALELVVFLLLLSFLLFHPCLFGDGLNISIR